MIDLPPDQSALIYQILHQHIPDRIVWAFGSRVEGRARRFSDLDLVIMGQEKLPTKTYLDMHEAFSEAALPIKIDISEWANLPLSLQQRIEAYHYVFYPRPR